MNCRTASPLMHEFLDGDLEQGKIFQLKDHLKGCPACRKHLDELEQTHVLIRGALPAIIAPAEMTSRVMYGLPKPVPSNSWLKWVRTHPAISAAALFIVVMLSSFLMMWDQESELVVKGTDLDQLVIEGSTVYVPEGRIIDGNLRVENGFLQVDGEVKGNVVVIDGKLNLASTAQIAGDIEEINQALGWLWYKMSEILHIFSSKPAL